jgi:hypothetical protein
VHTGAAGHEQLPQAQLAPHVCIPYVLHTSVALGEQAPWPSHWPSCQAPLTHVCVLVPQAPHATLFVVPGAHEPVHAPPMHVSFVHATAVPHWPHASHV